MITTTLFITLIFVDLFLIAVVFFAHDNEMYADVMAATAASILSWKLSFCSISGNVREMGFVNNITYFNPNAADVLCTDVSVAITDPTLSMMFTGVAILMTIITFGLVLEVGIEVLTEEE